MPEYVPPIATLRARAAQLIGRQVGRGELKAMLAAICAAENAGTPIPADSTGQTWITEASGIINQADQDALAILVREFAEFVENAGGGGEGDAPAVIAPFPGIGEEGVFYSQQVRTTGTTPQTFEVTSGALPTGWTLDASSGLITGTAAYPNGGLWTGEITITNTAGDVVYPYAILIEGTAPGGSYTVTPDGVALRGGVLNTYTPTGVTGSTGGDPAVPITYAFTLAPDPLLNAVLDAATGIVTMTPDDSLVGNEVVSGTITASNYFGDTVFTYGTRVVMAPVYWGEWHGALPGTFTVSNITTDLFDDVTPGPRVEYGDDSYSWITSNPWLAYPATGVAYARILAVPHGLFIGNLVTGVFPVDFFVCDISDIFIPCASLTPAWPTPYQSGLVIDGVTYDIYVVAAQTAAITLLGNSL